MVELFCDSFEQVPRRIVLDIDDTEDRVHGRQELALFHAHYGGYCFLPIHVYEAITGKPVAVILRPGKTPDGAEVALVLRHVIRAIRKRWPRVDILVRGDSHYGRPRHGCERNASPTCSGWPATRSCSGAWRASPRRRDGAGSRAGSRRSAASASSRYAAKTWHRAPGDRPGRGLGQGRGQPVRGHQPRRHATWPTKSSTVLAAKRKIW